MISPDVGRCACAVLRHVPEEGQGKQGAVPRRPGPFRRRSRRYLEAEPRGERPMGTGSGIPIDGVTVHVFTVPTDGPDGAEEDGTLRWESTTMVLVEARAGGRTGIGYTYGATA